MNISDILWILFFLFIGAGSVKLSLSWYRQPISPLSVFLGINCLSLTLYHLRLVRLNDLSGTTYAIIIISFISFFLGTSLFIPRRTKRKNGTAWVVNTKGLDTFFYISSIISTIGWVLPLNSLINRYGISFLFNNPWILEPEFQMQYIGYMNVVGIAVLPAFVLRNSLRKCGWPDILLVLLSLIGLTLAGIKTYLVFAIIAGILIYALLRLNRLALRYSLLIVIGFTIILVFFVSYDANIDIFREVQLPGSSFPEQLSFLEHPYVYFAGSWPAMDALVTQPVPPAQPIFGYVTLQPIWKLLGDGLKIIEPVPPYLPPVDISATDFNVYAFIGEIYWDFGLLGVTLLSFLFGSLITKLYIKAKSSGVWIDKLLYSLVSYILAISFFAYFLKFETVVLLCYVFFVGKFVSKKYSLTISRFNAKAY